jgi:hypothetical protein
MLQQCKGLYNGKYGRARFMQWHEMRPGMKVGVKEGHWKSQFVGMSGVVEQRWGNPALPALDVRLENGSLEFFWSYELGTVQGEARTA